MKAILIIFIPIILVACMNNSIGAGNMINPKSDSLKLPGFKLLPTYSLDLGNSATKLGINQLVLAGSSCINLPNDAPITLGPISSKMSTSFNLTRSQILSSLGVDGSLSINNPTGGNVVAKILEQNEDINDSFRFVVSGSSSAPVMLKDSYPQVRYDNDCGDGYISSTTAGIYFLAIINVRFNNALVKQSILANFDAKVNSFASLAATLDKLSQQYKNAWTIDVSIAQAGGDTSNIFNVFNSIQPSQDSTTQGFYFANIKLDDLQRFNDALEGYVREQIIFKQAKEYLVNINQRSQLSSLMLSDGGSSQVTNYDQAINEYDEGSLRVLLQYARRYTELLNASVSFNQYYRIVGQFEDTFAKPATALINIQDRLRQLNELAIMMKTNYHYCVTGMISDSEKKLSNECSESLNEDIDNVAKLINAINSSGFNSAFQLTGKADKSKQEYLVYLGGDIEDNKYFMTYSRDVVYVTYLPFSIYKFDSRTKKIYPESLNSFGVIEPVFPQYTFILNDADIYFNKYGIQYNGVSYSAFSQIGSNPRDDNQLGKMLKYDTSALIN